MNSIALISLLVLILVIVIGFVRKINVGLVAILAAVILGSAVGDSDSDIIGGFGASLFIMLLGVSFLCAVATTNGSLELAAKKFLRLSGGHAVVAPFLMYIIGYVIAAIGPGCVPALGIVAALSLPLGKTTGYDSVMLAAVGQLGSMAGRFSPITPESVLIKGLADEQGITGYQTNVLIYATVTTIVWSVAIFFLFKSHKVKDRCTEQESTAKFNRSQILTLLGFLVVIIASAFFDRNVGLISFAVGILLVALNAADEKEVFRTVSWSTLIMVTGVGMLMEIVMNEGGVELMSNALASIMTPRTAVAIQGLSAGLLSWFRHRRGVAHHGAHRQLHCEYHRREPGQPDYNYVPDRILCRIQPRLHRRQSDSGRQRHRSQLHQGEGEQALCQAVHHVGVHGAGRRNRRALRPVQHSVRAFPNNLICILNEN